MKLFALIAVVLALGLSAGRSHAQTGIELQHECQAVTAAAPNANDAMEGAHCLGYISGVAFSISMWEGVNKAKSLGTDTVPACLPGNGTSEEYVKVVLRYLDQNPNKLHEGYGLLVFFALRNAYPCPAK